MTSKPFIMETRDIFKYMPHRPPFLLVDRVLELDPGKSIVAIKNITINEPFFVGHFPSEPVMPGVLMLEALAQASVILAFVGSQEDPSQSPLYYFAGIDNARFKRVVRPGDQLRLEVEITKARKSILKAHGVASVEGDVACSADLMSIRTNE